MTNDSTRDAPRTWTRAEARRLQRRSLACSVPEPGDGPAPGELTESPRPDGWIVRMQDGDAWAVAAGPTASEALELVRERMEAGDLPRNIKRRLEHPEQREKRRIRRQQLLGRAAETWRLLENLIQGAQSLAGDEASLFEPDQMQADGWTLQEGQWTLPEESRSRSENRLACRATAAELDSLDLPSSALGIAPGAGPWWRPEAPRAGWLEFWCRVRETLSCPVSRFRAWLANEEVIGLDVEEIVLGMALKRGAGGTKGESSSDFDREDHRLILGAIKRLASTGAQHDALAVGDLLQGDGDDVLERAGGMAYLASLAHAAESWSAEQSKMRRDRSAADNP